MIGRWHWSVWLRGLVSAVISGAAAGVGSEFVLPDVAKTADPHIVLKLMGMGAIVGLANYLKQSPLPQEDGEIALPPPRGFAAMRLLIPFVVAAIIAIAVKGLLLTPIGGIFVPLLVFAVVFYVALKAQP